MTPPALILAFVLMGSGAALVLRDARQRRAERERRFLLAHGRRPAARGAGDGRTPQIPFAARTPKMREILRFMGHFGIAPERARFVFAAARLALAAAAGSAAAGAALRFLPAGDAALAPVLAVAAGFAAWIVPGMLMGRAARRRAAAVAAGLPDALELLVVCVEAGLSLEDGIARSVIELKHSRPALAEELALTAADLKILPSRDRALANFAARIDVPSLRALVTTLSQTLRYGTPLVQAMRNAAAELRADSLLRIEKRANELPVLLTIPMMLFIMPTIFLVVGGPAGLRIWDVFMR